MRAVPDPRAAPDGVVVAVGASGPCREGEHQVCTRQRQPGFHTWGSLAGLVALAAADVPGVRVSLAVR